MTDTQTRQNPLPFVVAVLLSFIVAGLIVGAVMYDDANHFDQMQVEIPPPGE
ncbi:MAG TPA: hypothetical protein VM618_08635 [Acidimicrobiia bacterium]|nr:hypothetical protein [Acidimicrobiia bacterium]